MNNLFWRIYHGDCRQVLKVNELYEKVDCIVTSPPYWNRRSYSDQKKRDGNIGEWQYSSRKRSVPYEIGINCSYESYIRDLYQVLEMCYYVLKENKFLFINIGNKHEDKELVDYSSNIIDQAKKVGFTHCDTIIWIKTNSQPPGRYKNLYLGSGWEYILMFAKGKKYTLNSEGYLHTQGHFKCSSCGASNDIQLNSNPNYMYAHIGCYGNKNKYHSHPAPFPTQVPKFCMSFTTEKNDIILDPFAGSGTTLRAALEMGRNAIGCELMDIIFNDLKQNMKRFSIEQ